MVRCPELDLKVSELSCVSRSGTLVRRGRHLHHWTKRHVVIAANFIFYYKHIGDKPAGVIWLDDAKAATVPAVDGRRHCFEVVTRAKRVFTFQGQNRVRGTVCWPFCWYTGVMLRPEGARTRGVVILSNCCLALCSWGSVTLTFPCLLPCTEGYVAVGHCNQWCSVHTYPRALS